MAPRVCLSSMSTTSWLARVRPAGGRIHPLLLALHILPEGFHRIRYYGFLGHRHRKEKLEQCRHALGTVSLEEAVSSERAEQDLSRPLQGSYRFFPVGMPRLPPRAHDRNPGDRSLRLFRINRHLLRLDWSSILISTNLPSPSRQRSIFSAVPELPLRAHSASLVAYPNPLPTIHVTRRLLPCQLLAFSRLPSVHSTPIDRLPRSGLLQCIFRPPPQLSTFCAYRHALRGGAGLNMLCIHIAP